MANETVLPEIRAAALYGVEELPPENVQQVASTLSEIGQQTGAEKDRLIAWTANNGHRPRNQPLLDGLNGSYPVSSDYRIALLLAQLESPPAGLHDWLDELKTRANGNVVGQPRWGEPDPRVENNKAAVAKAIKALEARESK